MTNCTPVQFTIVGASVAGLSCAYALRESGHRVRVLEKSSANLTNYGCLRVPPNMSRLLQDLPGMQQMLETKGSTVECLHFMKETSETLGRMEFPEEIMCDLGSKFYMVSHHSLCSHIRDLCIKDGVDFHYNVQVSAIEGFPGIRPTVITTTGARFDGDIVIGADGRNSVVRPFVLRYSTTRYEDDESDSGSMHSLSLPDVEEVSGCCISIPVAEMLSDPELAPVANSSSYSLWLCKEALLLGSRCGAMYNLGITRSTSIDPAAVDTDWTSTAPWPIYEDMLKSFGPPVQKLLSLAKSCYSTIQPIPRSSRHTDTPRSIVLIGDAAHAAPVHGTWNSALAVEDAFTLGTLFARIDSHDQITRLLDGFNEIRWRRNRCTEISELQALLAVTISEGTQREALYTSIGLGGNAEDDVFFKVYHTWLTQFDYDAKEAVEEWWLNWGQYSR